MRGLPEVYATQKSTIMTTNFLGYNRNEIIEDGEMHDMENMSGDLYPVLAPRRPRGITSLDSAGLTTPLTGIHGRDQLVYVRGDTVYYNGFPVDGITLSTIAETCPKKIVSFGAYVCIFPDKKYFNTTDQTDRGSMERRLSLNGNTIDLTMCRGDGTDYDMTSIEVGQNPPADPENGALWIDTSDETDVLRQYSAGIDEWVEVATTFVKIAGNQVGAGLEMYDTVEISGLSAPASVTDEKQRAQVDALNGSMIVYFAGDGYIVVAGLINRSYTGLAAGTVNIDRTVPDMDFVCESNNRLWGCKYGLRDGETVNEIYASALGSFKNWSRYLGNSQDSWTASVGTDGEWTGAITQRGYPVFFKEGYIHRVSGQTPSSFSITTTVCRGVQRGSWRSVAVVNEVIIYKSRQGVMMYDGNMPQPIGEQLGNVLYSDARAGALGDKYYISMKDSGDNWTQFVYDTKQGIWFKEDATQALGYGAAGDELFYIDEEHNTLVSVNGSMGDPEPQPAWSATFGLTGVEYGRGQYGGRIRNDITNRRYMSRFVLRIWIPLNTRVWMDIQYENSEWERMGEIVGNRLDSYLIPIIPRRCDHLRFRLSGDGACKIYSISRQMEVAGDG